MTEQSIPRDTENTSSQESLLGKLENRPAVCNSNQRTFTYEEAGRILVEAQYRQNIGSLESEVVKQIHTQEEANMVALDQMYEFAHRQGIDQKVLEETIHEITQANTTLRNHIAAIHGTIDREVIKTIYINHLLQLLKPRLHNLRGNHIVTSNYSYADGMRVYFEEKRSVPVQGFNRLLRIGRKHKKVSHSLLSAFCNTDCAKNSIEVYDPLVLPHIKPVLDIVDSYLALNNTPPFTREIKTYFMIADNP